MIGENIQIKKYEEIQDFLTMFNQEKSTCYRLNIQINDENAARKSFDFIFENLMSCENIEKRIEFQNIDIFIDKTEDYRSKFGNIFFDKTGSGRCLKDAYKKTQFNFIINNKECYVNFLKLFNDNIYPELSDNIVVKIFVAQREDYKTKFGNLFCEKVSNSSNTRKLKKEYQHCQFYFVLNDDISKDQSSIIWNLFIKLFNEIDYPRMSNSFIRNTKSINIFVEEQADITTKFVETFCDKEEGKFVVKEKFSAITFNFILKQEFIKKTFPDTLNLLNGSIYNFDGVKISIKLLSKIRAEDYFNFMSYVHECLKIKLNEIAERNNIDVSIESSTIKRDSVFKVFDCINKALYKLNDRNNNSFPYNLSVQEINRDSVSYFMIFNQQDYQSVFDRIQLIIQENDLYKIGIKKIYEKYKKFVFFVAMNDKDLDLFLLHNFVLLANTLSDRCKLEMHICRQCVNKQDKYRIGTFLSCLDRNTEIYFNGKRIVTESKGYRKVLPTFSVKDRKDYDFLANPISDWLLFLNASDESLLHQPYGYLLNACHNYIDKLGEGESGVYNALRMQAFKSEMFSNIVKTIPFLALLIFLMYDSFYRSDNLSQFKTILKSNFSDSNNPFMCETKNGYKWHFIKSDFVSNIPQPYDKYRLYDKFRQMGVDLKNIFDSRKPNTSNLHPTMISMIFESVSIAEGLLQIIENSINHANGCTISCRLYSRRDYDLYLSKTYSQAYLDFIQPLNSDGISKYKTQYYLETEITDLSKYSIPNKFKYNFRKSYSDKKNISNEMEKDLNIVREKFDFLESEGNEWLNLPYFYGKKSDKTKVFSKCYYSIPKNLVKHYGLEIFTNIVTARKGIFSVCGHNDEYSNLSDIANLIYKIPDFVIDGGDTIKKFLYKEINCKLKNMREHFVHQIGNNINSNKQLMGTSYRILLPVNYSSFSQNVAESLIYAVENKDCYTYYESNQKYFMINSIFNEWSKCEKTKIDNIKTPDLIDVMASNMKIENGTRMVFFDFKKLKDSNDSDNLDELKVHMDFETTIKAILLAILEYCKYEKEKTHTKPLAVAIVNINSIELIEASRILAIYYAKEESLDNSVFEKFQVYLKVYDEISTELDGVKEIIFAGKNLSEVTENILKSAMTNGSMNNEIETIIRILRMHKNEK